MDEGVTFPYDVAFEMLQLVDVESPAFIDLCTTNSMFAKVCADPHYWHQIYKRHELGIPSVDMRTTQYWIDSFKLDKLVHDRATLLVEMIEGNMATWRDLKMKKTY
ncbi:Hypothetical protein POVR1_LOCUS583 [uncultured virus]|nr:Hypothetical protein POVR1_LOCUS583 [uncultured virus]